MRAQTRPDHADNLSLSGSEGVDSGVSGAAVAGVGPFFMLKVATRLQSMFPAPVVAPHANQHKDDLNSWMENLWAKGSMPAACVCDVGRGGGDQKAMQDRTCGISFPTGDGCAKIKSRGSCPQI